MDHTLGATDRSSHSSSSSSSYLRFSSSPSDARWLVSPDTTYVKAGTQSVHSDLQKNSSNDATSPQDKRQHKSDHGLVNDNSDAASQANVFAGVIIFSVGMLVLIVAMTFYFGYGRSWKKLRGGGIKRNKGNSSPEATAEQGETGTDQERHNESTSDAELAGVTECYTISADIPIMPEQVLLPLSINKAAPLPSSSLERIPKSAPEQSPSTARLGDIPSSRSVFSFLKGPFNTQRQSLPMDGNLDSLSHGMHMPVLTRMKARSSLKRKSGPTPSFQSRPSSIAKVQQKVCVQQHNTIERNVQKPKQGPLVVSTTVIASSCSTSAFFGTPHPERKPSLDSKKKIITRSVRSTAPTLLRINMPPPTNPSIMGLYGSARSSPNGSMADAASVKAMYPHSLKSAMSSTTQTGSTHGGLDSCQDMTESKEVVLATANMERDPE